MKRAITIIGRFAFGGWAIVTGTVMVVFLVSCLIQRSFSFDFLWILFFGLLGAVGGGIVGLIAAVLERIFKRPVRDARIEADVTEPSVWPPAPKPPP
jgi:hypothetical protein